MFQMLKPTDLSIQTYQHMLAVCFGRVPSDAAKLEAILAKLGRCASFE